MSLPYKRCLVQVPLADLPLFEDYSKRYNLSLSTSIIFLAKKSLEQEDLFKQLPVMLEVIKNDQQQRNFKTSKKTSKKKVLKK